MGEVCREPALPEGDGQACAVEDPQGAGHSEHMRPCGGVIAVAQGQAG